MTYFVARTDEAQLEIRRLPPEPRRKVNQAIRDLQDNYIAGDAQKLRGHETLWRVRVGRRRIVYQVHAGARTITILRVRRREIVYDDLVEPPLPPPERRR